MIESYTNTTFDLSDLAPYGAPSMIICHVKHAWNFHLKMGTFRPYANGWFLKPMTAYVEEKKRRMFG